MEVRTRFAPSPTGYLHLGSARTALYSWLFAKHNQGKFILRIEDTDRERSTEEAIQAIIEGMIWMGLNWDEGPFYQMQQLNRYHEVAEQLLKSGHVYRCFCSKSRLEQLRETQCANKQKPRYDGHCRDLDLGPSDEPHVLRFRNPLHGSVAFNDHVYGYIQVENSELDDLVIVRSDGVPTYNFSVVVDDWDMKITHVIRGDDHLNNTPRQINILTALEAPLPEYAHLPMILGPDGKRFSKRHGATNVLQYREDGFLPAALMNYLVRLGWSHGDKEIFSRDEMIAAFSLEAVNKAAASYDPTKLAWMNSQYLKQDPIEDLVHLLHSQYLALQLDPADGPPTEAVIKLYLERCQTLKELAEKTVYLYTDALQYDETDRKTHFIPDNVSLFESLLKQFNEIQEWSHANIQAIIDKTLAEFQLKMPKLAHPLRVALTGSATSPGITDTVLLIGKQRVCDRLKYAIIQAAG